MAGDVLEKHPFGTGLKDDAGDVGPEMAGITGAAAFAGGAEGLAGISGEDGIESAPEGSSVEAAQIGPDRGRSEIPGALGRDEDGSWPVLPLNEGAAVIAGLGEHDAHIQASAACAEAESVPGT